MIYTWSRFIYGFDVDSDNQYLDVVEDGVPVTGTVEFGNYTLGEGLEAVRDALNAAGHNTYQVTVDRATRLVTISADDEFELPLANGPSAAASLFSALGFVGADLSGASSYTGMQPCGFAYDPQFMLQSYVPPENFIESVDATVNRAASGRVEVIRFGEERKIEMNVRYITNLPMDGAVIKNNSEGYTEALQFLRYITQKKRFEFLPDLGGETIHKVILESFPGYSKGTGFKLREMISENLADIYETGVMQLRVVT